MTRREERLLDQLQEPAFDYGHAQPSLAVARALQYQRGIGSGAVNARGDPLYYNDREFGDRHATKGGTRSRSRAIRNMSGRRRGRARTHRHVAEISERFRFKETF